MYGPLVIDPIIYVKQTATLLFHFTPHTDSLPTIPTKNVQPADIN